MPLEGTSSSSWPFEAQVAPRGGSPHPLALVPRSRAESPEGCAQLVLPQREAASTSDRNCCERLVMRAGALARAEPQPVRRAAVPPPAGTPRGWAGSCRGAQEPASRSVSGPFGRPRPPSPRQG